MWNRAFMWILKKKKRLLNYPMVDKKEKNSLDLELYVKKQVDRIGRMYFRKRRSEGKFTA